ncbi:MAG TPA: hypothetical protein VIM70_11460 [Clostridium sp.]|uniref:hypothetical protein n=1 Tax=Clostridium sp. TaxID=1506 RepID=UPI002F939785
MNTNDSISIDDLKKMMGLLDSLPPMPVEIQVSRKGYTVIMKDVIMCANTIDGEHGYTPYINGIKVVVKDLGETYINKARFIYDDGSSNIFEVYKLKGE